MFKWSLFKIGVTLYRSKHRKMQSSTVFDRRTQSKARSILNNVLNNSLTDSTDIAFNLVNEIANSAFESAQKPTAHSGSHVNKSTFEKWTEKFPCLIVNNIKEQMTLSCNICQEQRDTLKVLTNVWAHQVFKCLAYVDTWGLQTQRC